MKIACWVTVIITLLALAERQVFGSWDHVMRYRFTMEIDDNDQIHRGTTVQELHCWFNDGMFRGLGNALTCWTKGDALVIDMGKKGYLFALLTNDVNHRDTTELPSDAFINAILGSHQDLTAYSFLETSLHFGQNVAIKWNQLPLLVRYSNIEDALTLQKIDPQHLDEIYGPGVRFAGANVQLTFDWMNSGVKKLLIWDQRPKPWLIDGGDYRPRDLFVPMNAFTNYNGD